MTPARSGKGDSGSLMRDKATIPGILGRPGFITGSSRSLLVAPLSRLLIYTPFYQQSWPLISGLEWRLGRDSTNTIPLPDQLVSRQHAILKYLSERGFALVDNGSANGTFLNGKRMDEAKLLENGDHIIMGHSEIYFQQPVSSPIPSQVAPPPKQVLMIQSMRMQGEIWREILSSQGISVLWMTQKVTMADVLSQLQIAGVPLPQLLLLDIGSLKESPYDFCRWSRDNYPELQIILTSTMRATVFSSERRWARQQGACDLFPGFHRPNIFPGAADMLERIKVILKALEMQPTGDNALGSTLQAMQVKFRKSDSADSTP
jgi:CheY-like chemotaxis protein